MESLIKNVKQQNVLLNDNYRRYNKHSQFRDIRKTLINQRLKTYYDSYNSKHDLNYLNKNHRLRSKSQLSDYNQFAYENIKQSKSPQAPINIFISVQKLNKIKVGSSDYKKEKTKRSVISNHQKKRSNNLLQQQIHIPKYINQHATIKDPNLKETINKLPTNDLSRKKRFKTLEDSDLGINKKSLDYKYIKNLRDNRQLRKIKPVKEQQHPEKQTQKLKYQDLKYDYERFPAGFRKYKLLGRGGFSLVWMGFHKKTKKAYAIKQILTKNKYQTHLKEIWFCNYFFLNGKPRPEYETHPGVNNLLMMYDYEIQQIDTWIVYEMCDGSLGSLLYDLYKEQDCQQQKFLIKYKSMYLKMRDNPLLLKNLIIQIAKVLDLLSKHNIVHSDLKTENILIQQKKSPNLPTTYTYKLIDYGSSFVFTSLKQYTLATPEYMCPQLLNFILYQNKHEYSKDMLNTIKNYENISAIDVWGLGCVVLQIINGIPLWLSNATKILYEGHYIQKIGLLSVQNRSFRKIIEKQLQIVDDLQNFLIKNNFSGIYVDQQIHYILKRMLDINPSRRIKPRQILKEMGVEVQHKKFLLTDDDISN